MEVGGWVRVSVGIVVVVGKSSQNNHKPVVIFWSSIPYMVGFPKKKFGWRVGGWVG